MRPAEPPGPAGAVSVSCVGSPPPSTAGLLEVSELGPAGWVVGGQAASTPPHPALAHAQEWSGLCGNAHSPASGLDLGAATFGCRWKPAPRKLLELREEVCDEGEAAKALEPAVVWVLPPRGEGEQVRERFRNLGSLVCTVLGAPCLVRVTGRREGTLGVCTVRLAPRRKLRPTLTRAKRWRLIYNYTFVAGSSQGQLCVFSQETEKKACVC